MGKKTSQQERRRCGKRTQPRNMTTKERYVIQEVIIGTDEVTNRRRCRPSIRPGVWPPGALRQREVLGYGSENPYSNTPKWTEQPSECCVR